jgi:hypothetical protein
MAEKHTRSNEQWIVLGLVFLSGALSIVVGLALWDYGRIMGKLFLAGGTVILLLIVYALKDPES